MKKKINDTIYEVVEGIRVNEDGRAYRILQGMYDNSICYNNIKVVDPDEPDVPVEPDIPEGTTHTLSVRGTLTNFSDHWETTDANLGDDGWGNYTWRTRDSYYTNWGQYRTLKLGTVSTVGAKFNTGVFNDIPEDAYIKSLKIKFEIRINGSTNSDSKYVPYDFTDTDVKLRLTSNGMITDFIPEESDFKEADILNRCYLIIEKDIDTTYFTKTALEQMEFTFQHIYDKRYGTYSFLYNPKFDVEVEYVTYE